MSVRTTSAICHVALIKITSLSFTFIRAVGGGQSPFFIVRDFVTCPQVTKVESEGAKVQP